MNSNDSYKAEIWNNQFEPNDSREESITECPECEGHGEWSHCCGSTIDKNICQDCKQFCMHVECPKCKGDGVIDI